MQAIERFDPAIPIEQLFESPLNNRKRFNEEKLNDLAESIRQKGVITPLLARPVGGDRYELAAGHRRLRAAWRAGLDTVPVMVRPIADDDFLEILTVENLQREDVHELEEAQGYAQLLARPGHDVAGLAIKLGKSESYVSQRLKLLDLEPTLQEEFLEGRFSFSHALMLARLTADNQVKGREKLYDHQGQAVSAATLRREIEAEIYLNLHKVPWDAHDAELVPAAGSCTACPKRTGFHPTLFPDLDRREDYCQDRACFEEKGAALVELRVATVAKQSGKEPLRLSSQHMYDSRKKKKGIVYRTDWRPMQEVMEPGLEERCGHTKVGVVVEVDTFGRSNLSLGQRLEVCCEPKCEVHWVWRRPRTVPTEPVTVEEQLEEIRAEKDREIKRHVREKTISQFYESIAWPVSLSLAKDLLFSSLETNAVDGAIAFLGLQLPSDIADDKNYTTREPKAVDWLKAQIGPGGANQVAKLLVHELMEFSAYEGQLSIAEQHLGEAEAAAVRQMVQDEVGQRYAEREAALLNPPKPAAKKAAAKKKAGKK
jgi:ParB family chromosome partitioning protein